MRFKNWLGKYSNLASRTRWVRHARRYLNRQTERSTASYASLGHDGYATRRWAASRRWSASRQARAVMRRLDYYAMPSHAERLEDRTLLSAFNEAGATLNIDINSASENVAISSNGSTYTLVSSGTFTGTDTGNVTGTGTNTLTVTAAGVTTFNLINVTDSSTAATFTFNDSAANTYGDSISVTLDDATAETITFNGASSFTGAAALSVSTSRNILANSASSIMATSGDIMLTANRGGTAVAGDFDGIRINAATVSATTGNITLTARSGNTDFDDAIELMGATIEPTGAGSGTITLNGDGVVNSFDAGTIAGAQGDLIRDGHIAADGFGTRTFSTEIANGTYVANVTLGSSVGTTLDLDGLAFDASGSGNRIFTRLVTVDDERFDLMITRRDIGNNWNIRGLELIPAAQQAGVTVAGIDVGAGVVAPGGGANAIADRVTADTISGTAAPNTVLSVSSSAGTITSVDALASLIGTQIQTDETGAWSFTLQRPTGFAQPLIEVFSVDNSGFFSNNNVVTYNPQGGGRLFDFNSVTPTTQAGHVDVQPTQTYDQLVGFGWSTAITDSNDVGTVGGTTDSDLLRDSHGATTDNTFRVDIADGTYEITATVDYATDLRIRNSVGGATLASGIDAQDGQTSGRTHITFNYTATDGNGIQLQFDSQGNQPRWALNGLAIRDAPNGAGGISLVHMDSTETATASTYGISGLTAASIYTVTLSAGTIVNFGGAGDADPAYEGFQITGSTAGTLNIINPSTPGNATLTVEEVSGEADQSSTVAYTFPGAGTGRRFDFGEGAVFGGFTGVGRDGLFTTETGFGFTESPTNFVKAGNNLRNDGFFVDTHTFRVATGTGQASVRIYSTFLGLQSGSIQVRLEGGAATTINTAADDADTETELTATVGADGILEIAFESGTEFLNERGFVLGIDVVQGATGNLPAAAALTATEIGAGADAVTQSEVDAIVDAALVRFAAAGISDAELDQLRNVDVHVEDIGGAYLGLAGGNAIVIDDDAAGNGWFVDQSPLDDSEFDVFDSGTQLTATSGPAAGRTDLLTTVMHELGHHLGLDDLDADLAPNNLMTESLGNSTRRTAGDIDGLFSAQDILDELNEVH